MFSLLCEQVRVVLTAAAALDRETQSQHRLRVTAFDAGQPPHTGQLDVTVIVLDANDNSPVFEYSAYEVTHTPLPADLCTGTAFSVCLSR